MEVSTLESLFMACLAFGVLYALLALVFGEAIGHWLAGLDLPLLQPLSIVSAITGFGGCGLIMTYSTQLGALSILVVSAVVGIILCVLFYFLWVKPMAKAESTTAFSIQELEGSVGEVYTTVPARGFGEVVIICSSGRSNYIATSFDQVDIPRGSKVVVVRVDKKVLAVSLLKL
ncbi:NfeD family protein [Brevibacillus ginsengisoli]|uniref:NfeD family protein n=1 Tax=Brevibacillus ginsengisoli TaxID=363854 RepID=UPI003CE7B52E